MATLVLRVTPHCKGDAKHPNAFDARLDGDLICTSDTPLLDSARVLLKSGKAGTGDMLEMWHAGSAFFSVRGKVGRLAKLTIEDRPSGKRLHVGKYRAYSDAVEPRIDGTKSCTTPPATDHPHAWVAFPAES